MIKITSVDFSRNWFEGSRTNYNTFVRCLHEDGITYVCLYSMDDEQTWYAYAEGDRWTGGETQSDSLESFDEVYQWIMTQLEEK